MQYYNIYVNKAPECLVQVINDIKSVFMYKSIRLSLFADNNYYARVNKNMNVRLAEGTSCATLDGN